MGPKVIMGQIRLMNYLSELKTFPDDMSYLLPVYFNIISDGITKKTLPFFGIFLKWTVSTFCKLNCKLPKMVHLKNKRFWLKSSQNHLGQTILLWETWSRHVSQDLRWYYSIRGFLCCIHTVVVVTCSRTAEKYRFSSGGELWKGA